MTYDELVEAIGRGDKDEWLSVEESLIYKSDLLLKIRLASKEESQTGDSFREDWTDNLRSIHPHMREVYWVEYGGTKIIDFHTVLIDQRTIVPLPDSDDHASMDPWRYAFGKLLELYTSPYGGSYSLDAVLNRAGISVRN